MLPPKGFALQSDCGLPRFHPLAMQSYCSRRKRKADLLSVLESAAKLRSAWRFRSAMAAHPARWNVGQNRRTRTGLINVKVELDHTGAVAREIQFLQRKLDVLIALCRLPAGEALFPDSAERMANNPGSAGALAKHRARLEMTPSDR
jgi:hypothetical protein